MKRILIICLLAALLLPLPASLSGCAEEPLWEIADATKIDTSLYAPSGVCYSNEWGQKGYVDAPGMLLYVAQDVQGADGSIGTKTAFINKATGTSHLFCFDPLCEHKNCVASVFSFVDGMMAYNAVSDKLYCILSSPEFGSGGDSIYKVDMLASGASLVVKGDRNDVWNIAATGKYVFWLHDLPDGERELCRLDVETEMVDTYPTPEGKTISSFYVSGEYLYLLFRDEIEYYLTDPAFSETHKLEHFYQGMRWIYLYGTTAYLAEIDTENRCYTGLRAYAVQTGEEMPLLPEGSYWLSGFDGEYVYYSLSGISNTYRIKTDGTGEPELFYTFDGAGLDGVFHFKTVWKTNGLLIGATHSNGKYFYYLLAQDEAGKYTAKRLETYA